MKRLIACTTFALACTAHAAPIELVTEENPPFNYSEGKEVKGTSTEAVRALVAKAGLEANIAVMKWDAAYQKAQSSAHTCIYSIARVENRERLFKWFGPIGTNHWALYGLPTFDKKLATARDARFFKIGAVKNDAKVDFMRKEGASSIKEADKDADNPARLALPKTDPNYIDLWVTGEANAMNLAAKAGVKDLKQVLIVRKQDLYLACNPRMDKATLAKLEAAATRK